MQIKCTNSGTKRLFDPAIMDAPVEFDKRGKAVVTDKIGQAMVKKYSSVEVVEAKPVKKEVVEGGE